MAALVKELNPPTPFTFEGFRTWLEGHCDRRVLLVATPMPPGAPSGVWLRTVAADYLHYEQRTSPFHQAHIVATLAAPLLLPGPASEGASRYLMPNLQLQPGKPFHGIDIGGSASRSEAEAFAFEVLRRSGSFPGALQSRILLRRLQSLRSTLLSAAPSAAADVSAGTPPGAAARLYRSVIEIRDAALALRVQGPSREATTSDRENRLQAADPSRNTVAEADRLARGLAALDGHLRNEQSESLTRAASPADLRAEASTLLQSHSKSADLGE